MTTLQIPISKSLQLQAQAEAVSHGFSSLEDAVAEFLKKLAKKTISLSLLKKKQDWYTEEILTEKEAAHLDRRVKEIEEARKRGELFTAHNVDELMAYLDS